MDVASGQRHLHHLTVRQVLTENSQEKLYAHVRAWASLNLPLRITLLTDAMRLLGADTMARKNGKVRYAVVGLGYISQIAILPAFAHARSNSVLTALVSGDPKKLKSLSRKYGTKYNYSYEQYAECLASGEIDAVYIALPNHMHRAYTEAAARAGSTFCAKSPWHWKRPIVRR